MGFHLHPVTLGFVIIVILFYLLSKKFKKKIRPLASPAVPSVLSEYTTKTIGSFNNDGLSKYSKNTFRSHDNQNPAFEVKNDIINRNVPNYNYDEPISNELDKKKKEIWGNIAMSSFTQTHPSSFRPDDDFHSKPERDLKNTPQFANAKSNAPFLFENNSKTSNFNMQDSPLKEGFKQKMQKKDFYYLDTPSRIQMVKNESSGGNSFASPDTAFKKYESPRTSKASLNNSAGKNKLNSIKDFPTFAEKLENTKGKKKRDNESDQETLNKKIKKIDNNPDPILKKIKKSDLEPETTINKKTRKNEIEPQEAPKKRAENNAKGGLKKEQANLNEEERRNRNIKKIRAIIYKSSDESSEEENLPKRIKRKDIPTLSKPSTTIKLVKDYQKKEGIPEPSDFLTKKIKVQPEFRNEDQKNENTEIIQKNGNNEKKVEVVKEKAADDDELFFPKRIEEVKKYDQKEGKNNLFTSITSSPIKPTIPSEEPKKNTPLFAEAFQKNTATPEISDVSNKIIKKEDGGNTMMPSFSLFSKNNNIDNSLSGISKDVKKNEEVSAENKKEDLKAIFGNAFPSGSMNNNNGQTLFSLPKNEEKGPLEKEKIGGLFEPKEGGGLFGTSGNAFFSQNLNKTDQDPIKNENKAIESKPTDNKSLFGDVAGGLFAASQTSQPLENKGLFGNILNAKNDAPQPTSLFPVNPLNVTQQPEQKKTSGALFSNLIPQKTDGSFGNLFQSNGRVEGNKSSSPFNEGLFSATLSEKNAQPIGLFGQSLPRTGIFSNINPSQSLGDPLEKKQ